jgi:hypothetical protein
MTHTDDRQCIARPTLLGTRRRCSLFVQTADVPLVDCWCWVVNNSSGSGCTESFFFKALFINMLGRYNVTQQTSITFVPNTKLLQRNPSKHSYYVEHYDRLRKRSENLEIVSVIKKTLPMQKLGIRALYVWFAYGYTFDTLLEGLVFSNCQCLVWRGWNGTCNECQRKLPCGGRRCWCIPLLAKRAGRWLAYTEDTESSV